MTSKEALEYLTSKVFTGGNSILETEAECCKEIILQDLERLEKVETENKELKEQNGFYKTLNKRELNKLLELNQENEKLKKTIEIIIREKIKPSAFLGILKEYKYHNKVDIPYEKVSIYLDCELTQQEYDLLKEVLGNDK